MYLMHHTVITELNKNLSDLCIDTIASKEVKAREKGN